MSHYSSFNIINYDIHVTICFNQLVTIMNYDFKVYIEIRKVKYILKMHITANVIVGMS